jgi:hypothetical protein
MPPKRPKAQDLPNMVGDGVGLKKDKQLEALGDRFIEVRDEKAELATELGKLETQILDRMTVLGMSEFRFGDQIMVQKTGKTHVKIKTVKVENDNTGEETENED